MIVWAYSQSLWNLFLRHFKKKWYQNPVLLVIYGVFSFQYYSNYLLNLKALVPFEVSLIKLKI
jgi:hypothetical protein